MKQIYEWQRGEISKVTKNGETIMIGRSDNVGVANVAEILNSETAPLHARIAELEAGIQKASNDLYNYHFEPRLNISLHQISMDLQEALKKAPDHD